jgi:hypothetical protein
LVRPKQKTLYVLDKLTTQYDPYIVLLRQHDAWRTCTPTPNHSKVVNALADRLGLGSQAELLIEDPTEVSLLPDLDLSSQDNRGYYGASRGPFS